MRRCLRKRRKERKSIAAYIMDMKELDVLLQNMCIRIEADIKKTSKEPKITKAVLRRRLLLKKHYKNVDDRRTQILGRILQLENLHLNTLQVQSLKNVTKAHSQVNIDPDDVEELIDKLSTFTDDFQEISDRLAEDLHFSTDISDEELEKELYQEIEATSNPLSVSNFPVLHAVKHSFEERDVQGSMGNETGREKATAIDALS